MKNHEQIICVRGASFYCYFVPEPYAEEVDGKFSLTTQTCFLGKQGNRPPLKSKCRLLNTSQVLFSKCFL